jgi:hypothetical protein
MSGRPVVIVRRYRQRATLIHSPRTVRENPLKIDVLYVGSGLIGR